MYLEGFPTADFYSVFNVFHNETEKSLGGLRGTAFYIEAITKIYMNLTHVKGQVIYSKIQHHENVN